MDAAETALTNMMLERFDNDEDAFTIINQSTLMETMTSITDTLALMLGGIAAISLLVGGIGIMNIMLVSVTERTKEIGIRKAIGAGRGSIMMQFLIEALMVSLIGCGIGIALSFLILKIAGLVMDGMSFQLSMGVVWVAVGFSVLIGVIFGIYPANKAAKKPPIEALRYSG
jgi:putative ABC transport system permease protein